MFYLFLLQFQMIGLLVISFIFYEQLQAAEVCAQSWLISTNDQVEYSGGNSSNLRCWKDRFQAMIVSSKIHFRGWRAVALWTPFYHLPVCFFCLKQVSPHERQFINRERWYTANEVWRKGQRAWEHTFFPFLFYLISNLWSKISV